MRRILTFSLVISTLLCFDVVADQVILKNGDRLSGTILKWIRVTFGGKN